MTTINIQYMRNTDYISVQDSLEASLQDVVFAVFNRFNIATQEVCSMSAYPSDAYQNFGPQLHLWYALLEWNACFLVQHLSDRSIKSH